MLTTHNVPYVLKHIIPVFKQHICRALGLSQSGNLKEKSSSGVGKALAEASVRKRLAGEAAAQQVEVGQVCGVDFSGV